MEMGGMGGRSGGRMGGGEMQAEEGWKGRIGRDSCLVDAVNERYPASQFQQSPNAPTHAHTQLARCLLMVAITLRRHSTIGNANWLPAG
jgi:hypothetical protein